MDSRLLAGAYSKRYKYIEREQIEALKTTSDPEKTDVLSKARKLSQETNRRRKQLALKRKTEAAREEKRRQEILNRRHQEQQQATEKYQRYNVPARPPHQHRYSTPRHGNRRTHSGGLDEALRLVRGSSARTTGTMYGLQQNSSDPMERSYVRSSQSAHGVHSGQGEGHQGHARPQSGTQRAGDSSIRAELMERSLRNLTNSRSRFEQQLEQHQQLLVEQQQKSLHEFNEAIRREIDTDAKVQGTEEDVRDNMSNRTESLSSLDSLEEGNVSPLSSSLPENQAQQDFTTLAAQNDRVFEKTGIRQLISQTEVLEQAPYGQPARPQAAQDQSVRGPQGMLGTGKGGHGEPVTNARGTSHIIGPIPQGYNSPMPDSQPSSTPVVQGSYYTDSLETQQPQPAAERRVAVGTALRLPQQPADTQNQAVKQPAPALQYNSQLLAHRKFDSRPSRAGISPGNAGSAGPAEADIRGMNTCVNNNSVANHEASNAGGDYTHPERPKAHVYAWTSPSPVEQEPAHVPVTGPTDTPAGDTSPAFAANMATDRVMATVVNPQSSRSTATSATTTWVYQTVNSAHAHNGGAIYSQAGIGVSSTHQGYGNTNESNAQRAGQTGKSPQDATFFTKTPQSNQARTVGQTEIPRGQGQKPGSMTKMGSHSQSAEVSNYQNYRSPSRRHVRISQANKEASISNGTLGLQDGRLTVLDNANAEPPVQKRVVIAENTASDTNKEVRGILKRPSGEGQPEKVVRGVRSKFNVHDSLEIAKKHKQHNEEAKRKKVRKKAVRFADLHYEEEVEEDNDSADSMTDVTVAKENIQQDKKSESSQSGAQRARPASARMVTPKSSDAKSKAPRVASAGPARHAPPTRPKAAAHIIMSGENHSYNNHNHNHTHTSEASTAGITVHKSQLDKKVTLISNNFMSRIPMYTGSTTTTTAMPATNSPAANMTTTVYTASQSRPGASVIPANANVVTPQRNGYKTLSAGGDGSRSTNGKTTVVPTVFNSSVLPSHSHFSGTNNNNAYKAVYNENGLRIDRTPTDDEINNLWMNMRSILEMGSEKGGPPSASASAAMTTNNNNNIEQPPASRQTVQLSNKYIDGAALGFPNSMSRMVQNSTHSRSAGAPCNGSQAGSQKTASAQKNGYLQRYSLLQQRRNPSTAIGSTAHTTGVVEQTLHPMPSPSNGHDPRPTSVHASGYVPREEVTESMAGFLAAEQMVQTHGTAIRDSRVVAAMESAQQQQEAYNSLREKYAKGGPAALSMEEHRLLESLDRLNERLKGVEHRMTGSQAQPQPYSASASNHPVYVHPGSFRGHQIISSHSQRRNSAGFRPTLAPQSARLLNRHHY